MFDLSDAASLRDRQIEALKDVIRFEREHGASVFYVAGLERALALISSVSERPPQEEVPG